MAKYADMLMKHVPSETINPRRAQRLVNERLVGWLRHKLNYAVLRQEK